MEILLNTAKWSATVGAATLIFTLLKPLLDKRYSAKWRYGAWLAMAVLLLLAPVQWGRFLPQAPAEPPVVIEVPRLEVTVSPQAGLTFQQPSAGVLRPDPVPRPVISLEKALTALWLSGTAAFMSYYLLGTWRFTRRARRWSRPAGGDAAQVYEAVRQEMGLTATPLLAVSFAVDSPMAVGLFRPRLLLPEECFESRQLAFILRHELTHYRRRDLWYKLVLLAANALHWFNPLIWLLRREAEQDLELTCDGAVVSGADDETRRAYSEALLASIRPRKGRAVLSTHFSSGKAAMKERFRNILGKRGRKRGLTVLTAALTVTVAAAGVFGVRSAAMDGMLSPEELAQWQERLNSPEMKPYTARMYTDAARLPSEEALDAMFGPDGGRYGGSSVTAVSGTRRGNTLTLELEGAFPNGLTQGTLTLLDGKPASFATPLHTAVETAAWNRMERDAGSLAAQAAEIGSLPGTLEFTEMYITGLSCLERVAVGSKTYYMWELSYRMKPNDLKSLLLIGGDREENGWLTQGGPMGSPILIASVDKNGKVRLEEETYDSIARRSGYTWEEYLYCRYELNMEIGSPGLWGGWPELSLWDSIRSGQNAWALDGEQTALTYLSQQYGISPDGGLAFLRAFEAGEGHNHDQAALFRARLGKRTVTLLLARIACPMKDGSTAQFWQVCAERWDPDEPEPVSFPLTTPALLESVSKSRPGLPDLAAPTPMSQPDLPAPAASGLTSQPAPADSDLTFQPDLPYEVDDGSIRISAIPAPEPDVRIPAGNAHPSSGSSGRDDGQAGSSREDSPPRSEDSGVKDSGAVKPAPGQGIHTPTGIIGDFDGDGVRDEWVWINYNPIRLLYDPDTGDIRFDPPAPDVWETVYPAAYDPETGDILFGPGTPEILGPSARAEAEAALDPDVRPATQVTGGFDGDGTADPKVRINGQRHQVTVDPDTQDVLFDPLALEVWDTISTTAPGGAP